VDTVILKKRDLVACGCNDTVKSFVKLRELAKVTRHAYKIDIYIFAEVRTRCYISTKLVRPCLVPKFKIPKLSH